jgi:2',3'-cyclic-nucleotide 2'-phosphodiesterase (5'-nucleotidase family)
MKTKATIFCVLAAGMLLTGACKSHYKVVSVERTRLVVDSRYDAPNAQAMEFLKPYKAKVDSVMGPVVGRSAKYMTAQRPEGTLSNLLSDIMVWGGKFYDEKPDFGMYNIGGVRADLPKGKVTYGDVLDIAPFENKIAFTTLSGQEVLDLFAEIASVGGEGVSHSVRMTISNDGKLLSATLNGQPVDPKRDYRLATIDYLLGGTDKMSAFKKGRKVNSPQEVSNNTRFIIMEYFRHLTKQGLQADAEIEGRIVVKHEKKKDED